MCCKSIRWQNDLHRFVDLMLAKAILESVEGLNYRQRSSLQKATGFLQVL